MEDIKVVFTFELENGNTRIVTVKDLQSSVEETQLTTLGNMMIEKNGQYNGSKFVRLVKYERVVTNKETVNF